MQLVRGASVNNCQLQEEGACSGSTNTRLGLGVDRGANEDGFEDATIQAVLSRKALRNKAAAPPRAVRPLQPSGFLQRSRGVRLAQPPTMSPATNTLSPP